jgi:hypothetical protein
MWCCPALHLQVGRYGQEFFDFSAERMVTSVQESLARLQIPYIDIIQCHDIEFGSLDQVRLCLLHLVGGICAAKCHRSSTSASCSGIRLRSGYQSQVSIIHSTAVQQREHVHSAHATAHPMQQLAALALLAAHSSRQQDSFNIRTLLASALPDVCLCRSSRRRCLRCSSVKRRACCIL